MKTYILTIILIFFSKSLISQDYTTIYKTCLKNYIVYYNSQRQVDTTYQHPIDFFIYSHYAILQYLPDEVDGYFINPIKANKDEKKAYKRSKRDKYIGSEKIIHLLGVTDILHLRNDTILIEISESGNYYNKEYELNDFFQLENIQFIFRYSCESERYELLQLLDKKRKKEQVDLIPYKQNDQTLYEKSFSIFINNMKQYLPNIKELKIFNDGYLKGEEFLQGVIPDQISDFNIKKVNLDGFLKLNQTGKPYYMAELFVCETEGQLNYNIKYYKKKGNVKKKKVKSKLLFEGDHFYRYNCETGIYDLKKTDFKIK